MNNPNNVPSETECCLCKEWHPVRFWDVHLKGYGCFDCLQHLNIATGFMWFCGIQMEDIREPVRARK